MCPGDMLIDDLSEHIPNKGIILVARDGTTLCSRFDESVSFETFAIMSATMIGAAVTASREVGITDIKRIVIEAENGKMFVYPAGKRNILVIAVDSLDESAERYLEESLQGLGSV